MEYFHRYGRRSGCAVCDRNEAEYQLRRLENKLIPLARRLEILKNLGNE